jgi:hypothetical protein
MGLLSGAAAAQSRPVESKALLSPSIPGLSELRTAVDLAGMVEQLTRNQGGTTIIPGGSPLLKKTSLTFDFDVPDVAAATYLFNSVQGLEIPGTRVNVLVRADVKVCAKLNLQEIRVTADPKKPNLIIVRLPNLELEAKRPKFGEYGTVVEYGSLTNSNLAGDRVNTAINGLLTDLATKAEQADGAVAFRKEYKRLIEEELDSYLSQKFKNHIFLIKWQE